MEPLAGVSIPATVLGTEKQPKTESRRLDNCLCSSESAERNLDWRPKVRKTEGELRASSAPGWLSGWSGDVKPRRSKERRNTGTVRRE
jgi:hypothetical protein